ncbi:putative conserved transmembrane protein [uncultured Mycobacterium sp.]|uniref:Putative conserved transmembrane protein n=1 Tax=uncultured Mycobacterium sp. TaxID=171292 RepID=A0A1Y5NVM0_9MYCO|nr:putative conserved transmembrane protein [uncultured Mycobacterium sp.]
MEWYTIGWGRTWLVRLFGRNELLRRSDRVEALVAMLAAIVVVVAIPVAAAFGTSVKENRAAVYAHQVLSRHETTAIAVGNATPHAHAYSQTFDVPARWAAAGAVHLATVPVPKMAHAGDQIPIWTDDSGGYAAPPTPTSYAATEAAGCAVLSWLAAAVVIAAGGYGLHYRLNRSRYAAWDRELKSLAGDDGGRAPH